MELIIKIEDKKMYDLFVQFFKSIGINIISSAKKNIIKKRPFGLCKGEFTVPDNFNEELPADVISTFYQG